MEISSILKANVELTIEILEFDFSSAINGEKFYEFFGLNCKKLLFPNICLLFENAITGTTRISAKLLYI